MHEVQDPGSRQCPCGVGCGMRKTQLVLSLEHAFLTELNFVPERRLATARSVSRLFISGRLFRRKGLAFSDEAGVKRH
jgi:hypothetical protein